MNGVVGEEVGRRAPGQRGEAITRIDLVCEGEVPGIDLETFRDFAEGTKKNCIVSRALSAVDMHVEAKLV